MITTNPLHLLAAAASVFAIFKLIVSGRFLLSVLMRWWRSLEDRIHVHQFYKIPEFNDSFRENQLYRQVSVYVSSLASLEDSDFANLFSGRKPNEFFLQLDSDQSVHDFFLGARISWKNESKGESDRCRTFVLKIRREDKRRILRPYLQHIQTVAEEIEQKRREIKLFTNAETSGIGRWRSVPFTHPSTIETVAMDSDLKNKVRSDLEAFVKGKQYYHRLGRVWKRSYLLYGPAGTGKTSFVAAMAKFLCYDVYDFDLSRVANDFELKSLLLQTSGKSVIVIEDLDRFLIEKSGKVSLSGILNFMDGIFSCCGEERVMVFTMNSKENIDPAILRPGRLDVHIYFPLCDFSAFKTLATSYLGVKDHKLFPHVEEVFQTGASLSPAEIGEILMVNRSSPSRALKSVISALQSNGGGRGAGKMGLRLSESGSGNGRSDDSAEPAGAVLCRESVHTVREFRKLYGLLRLKSSGSRKGGSFELDEKEAS
ncbi:AAA-ATPase At2g46620 [Magnolia sinica]|uniref:AAA-ATPase At2g46620 n=1 Tax=Magnolia sinica TaxID=86752 RepID=UPI002659B2BB|nr:AAA-ATPase At2g46620 [Magnolia sinica]